MESIGPLRIIFQRGRIFTASNGLSFLRLLSAGYLYQVTAAHQLQSTLLLTALLILSDFADGFLARKFDQVSELGKVLDPLADKVCVAVGIFALYQEFGLPLWIMLIIIGRDVLILAGSLVLITRLPYVTPSAWPGKITVTVLSALFLSYVMELTSLQPPLLLLTIAAIAVSGIHYTWVFFQKLLAKNHSESDQP